MNRKTGLAALYLVVGVTFAMVGLHSVPRNNTYLILGVAFVLIAAVRFRRSRTPG